MNKDHTHFAHILLAIMLSVAISFWLMSEAVVHMGSGTDAAIRIQEIACERVACWTPTPEIQN